MTFSKNRLLMPVLVVVLVALVGVKVRQKLSPLYPAIISTDDNQRNVALNRLTELDEKEKAELRERVRPDLAHPNPRVRRYALYALRKIGSPDENVLAGVAAALGDTDAEVRTEAVASMQEYGPPAIPHAVKILNEGNETGAREADGFLTRVGPSCLPHVTPLLGESGRDDGQKRCLALIARWGAEAAPAAPAVSNLLASPAVEREAAIALVAVSSQNHAALPILEKRLAQSFDLEVVNALAAMGPAAKRTIPLLRLRLLEGKDSFKNDNAPRPAVARALAAVDPRKTDFNGRAWDLKQKDPVIRYRAAFELSRDETLDASAVPVLARSLNDSDPFVAARVAKTLVQIGLEKAAPVGDLVYPRLVALLSRVSEEKHCEGFRETLVPALVQIGQLDKSAAEKI